MPLLQFNLTPSRKELRWFAALWWPAMCAAAGTMAYRKFPSPVAATWIWIVGGVLAAVGFISPRFIRPVYTVLMRLTFPIGWCVSHVVLAVMYFLILTPIGFLLRLFHDPMERKFATQMTSYWSPRQAPDPNRYFRQL
jgi:hypothetical protein